MFYVPCSMNKGFTLIEVTIAIFVLLIGILGVFAATQQIISYISLSNSKLTAIYLAQEGVEIVRNTRDSNWLDGINWNNGLTICAAGCEADYDDSNLFSYSGNPLNFETAAGFYGYGAGDSTKFKRKITIDSATEDILKITVLIEWEEKGRTQEITVREDLYNWW